MTTLSSTATAVVLATALLSNGNAAHLDTPDVAPGVYSLPAYATNFLSKVFGGFDSANDHLVTANSEGTTDTFVIGGSEVDELMGAAVLLRPSGDLLCSGTQIGPEWFLTAKHCTEVIRSTELHEYSIRLGSLTKASGGVQVRIAEVHEAKIGDVALVRLDQEITDYPMMQLADKLPAEDTEVDVYGWGMTQLQGAPAEHLKTAQTTFTGMATDLREGPGLTLIKGDGMANRGDSGGPAVSGGVQVGVCSGGTDTGTGFYGSVPFHRDWIRDVSGI